MPRGHPLTDSQKVSIFALADEGLSGPQIATETGIGRTTVYRLLSQHEYSAPLVKLIVDPAGLFSRRAEFGMPAIALGIRDWVWAEGTVFELSGQIAEVIEGQLICGKKRLEVKWNGKYEWVENR